MDDLFEVVIKTCVISFLVTFTVVCIVYFLYLIKQIIDEL